MSVGWTNPERVAKFLIYQDEKILFLERLW